MGAMSAMMMALAAKIMLEGRHDDGRQMQWIFSDIRNEGFLWRNMAARDEGRTWELMHVAL